MKHLFVTQDYAPDRGGMARRHVELCRRLAGQGDSVAVSTVANDAASGFDAGENYPIERQPFPFSRANRFANQLRWAHSLVDRWKGNVDVIHCGNIRPVGYAVQWAHRRLGVPYLLYVNGGDLLRERRKADNPLKRIVARRIFSHASGIVATSSWVAQLSSDVMREIGVKNPPRVAAIGLGTDPAQFSPSMNSDVLRRRWHVGTSPIMLTVARLVPHKGQDVGIRVLAELHRDFPDLHYVLVGDGHYEGDLRRLAVELGVAGRVVFAGNLTDAELPEAYATSTMYLGLSRIDREINAEGFGISFLEAAASGIPSVAGDSGGVSSAVLDQETGFLVSPTDVQAAAEKVRLLLIEQALRTRMGEAGRKAVETHFNWERVARDTREFTHEVVAAGRR
jgi:phosphatidylinositol alpha-1,6-mannosyltransferase